MSFIALKCNEQEKFPAFYRRGIQIESGEPISLASLNRKGDAPMKCIVADWEVRNLGCNTLEVIIEENDSIDDIKLQIGILREKNNIQYVVLKNSYNYAHLNWEIQEAGFKFVETQIDLKIKREMALKKIEEFRDFNEGYSYREADINAADVVLNEVKRGIFSTDRVSLDPNFGIELANNRYCGWILDEMKRGGRLGIVSIDGIDVGFRLYKNEEKVQHDLLAGMYKNKCQIGVSGAVLYYEGLLSFVRDGMKAKKTATSANNMSSLRLHLMYGNEIYKTSNVFVRHY